jgi:hypothetical protein
MSRKRLEFPDDPAMAALHGQHDLANMRAHIDRFMQEAQVAQPPRSIEADDADDADDLAVHMNLVLGVLEGREASSNDVVLPTTAQRAALDRRDEADADALVNIMRALADSDSSVAYDESSDDDDDAGSEPQQLARQPGTPRIQVLKEC